MDLTRFLSTRKPAAPDSGAPTRMIVGLGNPGPEYARNRHNIGFQVVDLFAGRHGLTFDKFQKRARLGDRHGEAAERRAARCCWRSR